MSDKKFVAPAGWGKARRDALIRWVFEDSDLMKLVNGKGKVSMKTPTYHVQDIQNEFTMKELNRVIDLHFKKEVEVCP